MAAAYPPSASGDAARTSRAGAALQWGTLLACQRRLALGGPIGERVQRQLRRMEARRSGRTGQGSDTAPGPGR